MKSIKHVILSVILIMLCAGGAYGGEKKVYTLFDEKAHKLTYYYDDQYYNEVERPGIIAFYEPTSMRFDGYNNKVFTIVIDESMKEAEASLSKRRQE